MDEKTLPQLQAEHTTPPRSRASRPAGELAEKGTVRNYIRDLVLGVNDGIVSVYALVAGIAGSGFASHNVGIAGIAATIAGALSMGLGEYVSTKSQSQYYAAEARREREHIRAYPELEREELREMLVEKGYPERMVVDLVEHLSTSEDRFVEFMMREEFGVGKESDRSPVLAMLLIMGAFVVGAALPVVPFFVSTEHALALASACAVGGLFLAGAAKGRASGLPILRSGLEMAVLGGLAAAVTWYVGRLIGAAA